MSIILSSLRRMRAHVAGKSAEVLEDSLNNNRMLMTWLVTCSDQIEKYLGREIEIKQRKQRFSTKGNQSVFRPYAYPIINLALVEYDPSGLWNGEQTLIEDCFIGEDNNTINLPSALDSSYNNALQITYTGGLAYHAVNSRYTMSSLAAGQSWTVGNWIKGSTSDSIGLVNKSESSNALLTVETYYGKFIDGEELIEYTDEAATTASGMEGTISSIERQSLSEKAASLVMAVEMQARYDWSHTLDFENTGFEKNGVSRRRYNTIKKKVALQTEVIELLDSYRKSF